MPHRQRNEAFELNCIAPLGNNIDDFEIELTEYSDLRSFALLSLVFQRFIYFTPI